VRTPKSGRIANPKTGVSARITPAKRLLVPEARAPLTMAQRRFPLNLDEYLQLAEPHSLEVLSRVRNVLYAHMEAPVVDKKVS